ncbi:hypothetical protein F4782DRAFT_521035 [Xylaria castorea]|nr:hypothetical protein F4782DRAFT_521035 [Xylaria castorea]
MKITTATLTSNASIWKPSLHTPYCSLKLTELGLRPFPVGILQVLSGTITLVVG